jgi:hypothetical protein
MSKVIPPNKNMWDVKNQTDVVYGIKKLSQ